MLHTPICGFFRSSSVKPIPYNIACAAGCVGSCVIVFEYLFSSFICHCEKRSDEAISSLCLLCYRLLFYYHLPLCHSLVRSIHYSTLLHCHPEHREGLFNK